MPFLDPRLVLVDLVYVDGLLLGVGRQWEDAVHHLRASNAVRVGLDMQPRLFLDDAPEGGLCRRLAPGCGLEVLDFVPLDVDRDPLLGTVLGEDLIGALGNRSLGLGSTHALWIEGLQMLYRARSMRSLRSRSSCFFFWLDRYQWIKNPSRR